VTAVWHAGPGFPLAHWVRVFVGTPDPDFRWHAGSLYSVDTLAPVLLLVGRPL